MTRRGPRNPAPLAPMPLQGDPTTPIPYGTFPAAHGGRVSLTQHRHPDFASRNRYDVVCDACGPLATYNAQAYGNDYTTKDGCDRAARDDAREHAFDHARLCPGPIASPLTVPLDVHAAATLLFSSEAQHVETLDATGLRHIIATEFVQRGYRLDRAEADVAYEYGEHPETAAAHMRACILVASQLMGVAP